MAGNVPPMRKEAGPTNASASANLIAKLAPGRSSDSPSERATTVASCFAEESGQDGEEDAAFEERVEPPRRASSGGQGAESDRAGRQEHEEDADDQARGERGGADDVGEPAGPEDLVTQGHEAGDECERGGDAVVHPSSVPHALGGGLGALPCPDPVGIRSEGA